MGPPALKAMAVKNRKPAKSKAGRGRGEGKNGGVRTITAPVRFTVATIVSQNDSTVRRKRNGVLFEGITLCVKSKEPGPIRKRPGRPRKLPLNPIADATDLIYLSNSRSQVPPKYIPLQRGGRGGGMYRTPPSILSRNYLQPKKSDGYVASTATVASHTHSSLISSGLVANTSHQTVQTKVSKEGDWPKDLLQNLVDSWDKLPESQTRELVMWFQRKPLYPQHPLPYVVRKNHALVSEVFSPGSDQLLDEYTDWLYSKEKPEEKPPVAAQSTPPPKVVVESQPSSLQDCCQWSSMTSIHENQRFNST